MASIIYSLFGSYQPVEYLYTEKVWDSVNEVFVDVSNYVIPSGASGVNWEWLSGVFLFGVTLWSFFRLLGGIFSGK